MSFKLGDRVRITSYGNSESGADNAYAKVLVGVCGQVTDVGSYIRVHFDHTVNLGQEGTRTSLLFDEDELEYEINFDANDELPEGTIAIIGHRSNGQSVTRQKHGVWTYNAGDKRGTPVVMDMDTVFKGTYEVIYTPGR